MDSVNSCVCQFCCELRQLLTTYVSFIGYGFLNYLFIKTIETGSVGIKLSMPLIWLMEEHATMQPHFHRFAIQNLTFPVFNETENCYFHIFRFLVKNNFVVATSTFLNNGTISVSEKDKKSPVWNVVTLAWCLFFDY